MKNKNMIFITIIVILIPTLVGIILWNKLPDDIAIHFNINGEADNWCYKGWAIIGLPLFILAIHFLCLVLTNHDPKRENINSKIYSLVLWICPVCSIISGIIIYSNALNFPFSVFTVVHIILGIGLMIIGNFLPKSRQNFTIGIRLPWTLNDKENWNSTHRFAGKLWIIGGLILIANSFFNSWIVTLIIISLLTIIPIIYSLNYYIRHKNNG